MNHRRLVNAAIRTACACVWASGAATVWAADAATHWHDVATTAINAAGRFPAGITDLAKVHLAIHDAVQAFEHTAEPYCADIANASGAPEAAVARAARDVLVAQLPAAQDATVEAAYQDSRCLWSRSRPRGRLRPRDRVCMAVLDDQAAFGFAMAGVTRTSHTQT